MLDNTVFSPADGVIEIIAFVGFAVSTIAFFVWVAWLVRQ